MPWVLFQWLKVKLFMRMVLLHFSEGKPMSTDVGMRIARSELKNAFFAPTIFFIHTGLFWFDHMDSLDQAVVWALLLVAYFQSWLPKLPKQSHPHRRRRQPPKGLWPSPSPSLKGKAWRCVVCWPTSPMVRRWVTTTSRRSWLSGGPCRTVVRRSRGC